MCSPVFAVLFSKRPIILTGFIGCLLISLSACANSTNSEALERSLAADPKLKDNPAAFGLPSQNNSPNETLVALPSDFPSEIPVYPEAQLQEVTPSTSDPNQGQILRWTTSDPSNSVQSFYQKEFQSNNWEIVSQPTETEEGAVPPTDILVARQNNLKVTVSIQSGSGSNSFISTPSPTPATAANSPASSAASTTQFTIQYVRDGSAAAPSSSNSEVATQPTTEATTDKPGSPSQPSVFTDINKAPQELRQYVENLAALGVLSLNSGGSKSNSAAGEQFEPNKTITRRQYARWLVAANNQIYANSPGKQIRLASTDVQPAFQDIPRSDPDFPAIQGLAEAGLIPSRLTGDATAVLFRPDAPLTRENLILWKVPLDTRQTLPTASVDAVKQTWGFQDAGKTEPKALRAVLADFQNGELANIRRVFGYTTLFQPKKPVTRAEAAAAVWYFGAEGEGVSAQDALQSQRQQSQPSAVSTPEPSPSSSPNQ
ncbi:S-layer homology domain-containing protein [Coleofasciculus sp. FACHB-T130]|uniref:S-layer homology domain-containing protein n=1 Tax=Cyanophyceae TaxID=3028117 RepID=UPI001682C9E2|nr:S-layer homology domain-containing protein [Coleofasciculus sp. FACHB-T130]MBD1882193.1 S-layer homology domain-containing protein [Coleofasciculus sp. FACHB-T130]